MPVLAVVTFPAAVASLTWSMPKGLDLSLPGRATLATQQMAAPSLSDGNSLQWSMPSFAFPSLSGSESREESPTATSQPKST